MRLDFVERAVLVCALLMVLILVDTYVFVRV